MGGAAAAVHCGLDLSLDRDEGAGDGAESCALHVACLTVHLVVVICVRVMESGVGAPVGRAARTGPGVGRDQR